MSSHLVRDEVTSRYPDATRASWQRFSRLLVSGLAGCLLLMAVRVVVLRLFLGPLSRICVRGKLLG